MRPPLLVPRSYLRALSHPRSPAVGAQRCALAPAQLSSTRHNSRKSTPYLPVLSLRLCGPGSHPSVTAPPSSHLPTLHISHIAPTVLAGSQTSLALKLPAAPPGSPRYVALPAPASPPSQRAHTTHTHLPHPSEHTPPKGSTAGRRWASAPRRTARRPRPAPPARATAWRARPRAGRRAGSAPRPGCEGWVGGFGGWVP
jgi:hypothetical protein